MHRILATVVVTLASGHAWADKYGIDEAMSESEGSWGSIALVILLFLYLHFKEK